MGKRIAMLSNTPHQRLIANTALQIGFEPVLARPEQLQESEFDGIMPVPEPYTEAACRAASERGLWGMDPDAANSLLDKAKLRMALRRHGVREPFFSVVSSESQGASAARIDGSAVVVKPARGYAGRGVHLTRHPADVPLAVKQAWRAGEDRQVLVERWIPGDKLCADAILANGEIQLQGIIEELFGEIHCTAVAAVTSPELAAHAEATAEAVGAACAAVGISKGFIHAEFGLDDGNLSLIRLAPYPSCYRHPVDLHKLAGGTDLLAQCILAVAGEKTQTPGFAKQGAALVWLKAGSGVVQGVDGLDRARRMPGVLQVEVPVNKGDIVGHPVDRAARDRLGHVVATGETGAQALERARDAALRCKVLTSPNL